MALTCLLVGQNLEGAEAVLRGVRRMAAQELAAEPAVRAFVREQLVKEAVITTSALPLRAFMVASPQTHLE